MTTNARPRSDDRRGTPPLDDGGEPYETWTKQELYNRAKELGIGPRAGKSKAQLIEALRRR